MLVSKVAANYKDLLTGVKSYLVIEDESEDTKLLSLINSVISNGEKITGRQFGLATFELFTDSINDDFVFQKNPIESIESIELLDSAGNYNLVDEQKYYLYAENEISSIGLLENLHFIDHKKAVKITFVCGYKTIPAPLITWIEYKTMCLFDDRPEKVNGFVDSLIESFKVRSF